MEFSRQEYWSGLPFPSPGNLLNPGIKPGSPALWADTLPFELPGKTYDLGNAGNLISGSSSFSKSNLDIWSFLVHIMQKTWVQSLGWGDPLEKEAAIHSSTIAWKIPWTEEPGSLQSMGSQRVGHDWATSLSLYNHKVFDLGHSWMVQWCSLLSSI